MLWRRNIREYITWAADEKEGAPSEKKKEPPKAPGSSGSPASSGLRVSLMPADENAGGPSLQRRLIIFGIVVFVELVLIGVAYFVINSRIAGVSNRREELLAKIDANADQLTEQQATVKDLITFNKQIASIENTLDSHVYWTNFFAYLEKYTLPNVIYQGFTGDVENSVITVDGVASTLREMAEQVVTLRESPLVLDVRAQSAVSQLDKITGKVEEIGWSMIITFDPVLWTRDGLEGIDVTYETASAAPAENEAEDDTENATPDSLDNPLDVLNQGNVFSPGSGSIGNTDTIDSPEDLEDLIDF